MPLLGTSVEVVQTILALHAIWSICVPIALVDTLARPGRWLRTRGLVVVGLLFLAGSAFVFFGNYSEEHFMAAWWQFAYAGVAIVALVLLAFRVRPASASSGAVPSPWLVGASSLVATSAYWGSSRRSPATGSSGWAWRLVRGRPAGPGAPGGTSDTASLSPRAPC